MELYAFDTETYLITPDCISPRPVCYTWSHRGEHGICLPDEGVERLRAALTSPGTIVAAHNLAFDFGVMVAYAPELLPLFVRAADEGRLADTELRERLIRIAQGEDGFYVDGDKIVKTRYGLAYVLQRYTGVDIHAGKTNADAWRLRYAELDGIPLAQWPQDAIDYAIDDARYCVDVYRAQAAHRPPTMLAELPGFRIFESDGTLVNEHEQVRGALALQLISMNGMRADARRVSFVKHKLNASVKAQSAALLNENVPDDQKLLRVNKKSKLGYSKNTVAIKARARVAYGLDRCALPEEMATPTGAMKVSRDVLEESGDPGLIALATLTGDRKILSAFVPVLEQAALTGVTPGYRALKATGRAGCYDPNIQQLPRKGGVRECFVPSPGFVFCSIDYDALELSCVAQAQHDLGVPRNPPLMEAINGGSGPHLITAADILGVTYEEVKRMYKSGSAEERETATNARQYAKILNFGAWGGLGPKALVKFAKGYGIDLAIDFATTLLSRWKKLWRADEYFDHAAERTSVYHGRWGDRSLEAKVNERQNFIVQLRSMRVRGGLRFTQACNSYFQGMAADGAKLALWNLLKACFVPSENNILFGASMAAFIHDEVIFEFPEDRAHEMAHEAARIMRESMQVFVPDVKIGAEPALMRRWYKDAEPFYVDGRLAPWDKLGVQRIDDLRDYLDAGMRLDTYAKIVGPPGRGIEEFLKGVAPHCKFEARPSETVEFYSDHYVGCD